MKIGFVAMFLRDRSEAFPLGPVGPVVAHARAVAIADDDGVARPSNVSDSVAHGCGGYWFARQI